MTCVVCGVCRFFYHFYHYNTGKWQSGVGKHTPHWDTARGQASARSAVNRTADNAQRVSADTRDRESGLSLSETALAAHLSVSLDGAFFTNAAVRCGCGELRFDRVRVAGTQVVAA